MSAWNILLRYPLYRGAAIAMLLSGISTSMALPQIVLFLSKDLGALLPIAALFYLTGLSSPVAGYLIGRRSDRTGQRMGLFRLCVIAGFVGWLGMALSTQVWQPFALNAIVLAFSGASMAQIFAAMRDAQNRNPDPQDDDVTALVRMALTAGWVIGPVAGSMIAGTTSLRFTFGVTAVVCLAQLVPLLTYREPDTGNRPGEDQVAATQAFGFATFAPLLLFTMLFTFIYLGEPIKYGFLPVYMTEDLSLQPALSGFIIGLQPLVELVLMPFAVPLAKRIGAIPSMALAALMAFAANLCFALWPSATGMLVGQALMGITWGLAFVLGILVAQRLQPHAVATASAIFMNAPTFASALGGAIGGAGVAGLGLPGVFLLPAVFAGISTLMLVWSARKDPMKLQS